MKITIECDMKEILALIAEDKKQPEPKNLKVDIEREIFGKMPKF